MFALMLLMLFFLFKINKIRLINETAEIPNARQQ